MKSTTVTKTKKEVVIIRKCHLCGQVHESTMELQKCVKCNKSFLPLNYFEKVHNTRQEEYNSLFAESHELGPEDMIKGLFVLW